MADLVHTWPGYIQAEEQQFTAAVSEYTGQRMGQAMNYFKDTTDSHATRLTSLETVNVVKGNVAALSFGASTNISSATITKIAGTVIQLTIECSGAELVLDPVNTRVSVEIRRGGTGLASVLASTGAGASSQSGNNPMALTFLDTGLAAGSYTYHMNTTLISGSVAVESGTVRIVAQEIR